MAVDCGFVVGSLGVHWFEVNLWFIVLSFCGILFEGSFGGLGFGLGVRLKVNLGVHLGFFRGLSKIHNTVANNVNMKITIKMTSSPYIEHILVV